MKRAIIRLLDWALVPDVDCLPLNVLQGTVVVGVGIAMVVRGYVRAGFKWPCQRGGWA